MSSDACDKFRPCVVIPVYNHHQYLGAVLTVLAEYGLPCILVDDGSEPAGACRLDELASEWEDVTLLRQPRNTGKGAAVCRGLLFAYRQGFTHALQVDADGQHDLDAVADMLASAQAHPLAVISGSRDYQAMPASRRSGRRFTDMWVCIHTLSAAIEDSMCGFRVYPLAATNTLLAKVAVGRRMDFDTDIIVRLYWQGVPVINVPTVVIYHQDIASHFDVWRDNLRISLMHARLFFGMLIRIPGLLMRRAMNDGR